MADKKLKTRIQLLRKTSDFWNETDQILREGEIGYDLDRKVFKVGDGKHTWKELRVTFTPFKDIGITILEGGEEGENNPDQVNILLKLMTESSPRYNGEYIPKKGEPVAIREGGNQYLKIGDGVTAIDSLPFVTPNDDASVTTEYGICEDFKV